MNQTQLTSSVTLFQKLFSEYDSLERTSHIELHMEGLTAARRLDSDPFDWRRGWPAGPYSAKEEEQMNRFQHFVLKDKRW